MKEEIQDLHDRQYMAILEEQLMQELQSNNSVASSVHQNNKPKKH